MSIWSYVSGTVNISKSKHVSVRKLVNEIFLGEDYSINLFPSETKEYIITFEMGFRDDGDSAIKRFKKLLKALDDVKISYDLNLDVRFVSWC